MRIIYMGTPDFAVKPLEAILSAGHHVCAVFTQPDKPQGRHYVMTPPPVKVVAQQNSIPVYQPQTFKNNDDAYEIIASCRPDCIVVAAYGRILPQRILSIPPLGCINIHGSILPKYRGAAPIQWSVINGDKQTGVTTMYMARGLDTGDIIEQAYTSTAEKTAGDLHDELSVIGSRLILSTLEKLENGTACRTPQNEAEATYAPLIDRSMGEIRFDESAFRVECLVRGMYPWPGAFTTFGGKKIKVRKAKISDKKGMPGVLLDKNKLIIGCKEGSVELLEVVPEGSKPMSGEQFLMGRRLEPGAVFGKEE